MTTIAHEKFITEIALGNRVRNFTVKLTKGDEELTEDLIQDAYLSALRFLRCNDLQKEIGFTWFATIISRKYIDYLRRENRRAKIETEIALGMDDARVDNLEIIDYEEQTRFINTILEIAHEYNPEWGADMIKSYFIYGYGPKEISINTGINNGTIKTRMFRLLRVIKRKLAERGINEENIYDKYNFTKCNFNTTKRHFNKNVFYV